MREEHSVMSQEDDSICLRMPKRCLTAAFHKLIIFKVPLGSRVEAGRKDMSGKRPLLAWAGSLSALPWEQACLIPQLAFPSTSAQATWLELKLHLQLPKGTKRVKLFQEIACAFPIKMLQMQIIKILFSLTIVVYTVIPALGRLR